MAKLGDLILDLKLNDADYQQNLEQCKKDAIRTAQDITSSFAKISLDLNPKVNHKELTKLNQHLDLKERHVKKLQQYLNTNPIAVKVNTSPLDELEKRLKAIKSGSVNARVKVSGNVSSSGSSSGSSSKLTADDIGKAVAKHSRKGIGERVAGFAAKTAVNTFQNIASIPLKIASGALSGLGQGITLGITQEISKKLGSGLSRSIENSLSGLIGSTDLFGEKLGDGLAEGITLALGKGLDSLPGVVSGQFSKLANKFNLPPQLTKEIVKEIEEGIREDISSIRSLGVELKDAIQDGIGKDVIANEALFVKGSQRKEKKAKTPLTREQAALELQQRTRGFVNTVAEVNRTKARSEQELPQISRQVVELQKKLKTLQSDLSKAQKSNASPSEIKMLISDLNVAQADLSNAKQEQAFLAQFFPKRLEKLKDRKSSLEERLPAAKQEYENLVQKGDLTKKEEKKAFALVDEIALIEKSLQKLNKALSIANKPIESAKNKLVDAKNQFDALAPREQPKVYRDLIKDVFGDLDEESIPQLVSGGLDNKNSLGEYNAQENRVRLRPDIYQRVVNNKATKDDINVVAEELEHAKQFGLGSFEGIIANRNAETLTPLEFTTEDVKQYGHILQAYSPDQRPLELDAKLKADKTEKRYTDKQSQANRLNLISGTTKYFDLLGNNIKAIKGKISTFNGLVENYSEYIDTEKAAGVIENVQKFIIQIEDKIALLSNNTANAEVPDAQSLENALTVIETEVEQYNALLANKLSVITAYVSKTVGDIKAAKTEQARLQLEEDKGMVSELLPQFSKKELLPLAQEMGIEGVDKKTKKQDLINRIVNESDMNTLKPRVFDMTRAKAQKEIERQESRQELAENVGRFAKGATGVAQGIVKASQPLMKATGDATKALATVAKAGYGLAEGVESLALDLLPMGRTIKAVGKEIALPAVAFGAATHFLPGGQVAGEALTHLTQNAIAPLAHNVGGGIAQSATEFIGHAVPNIFNLQGTISGAVTGAIEAATSGVTSAVGQAGAMLLGGKAMQTAVSLPIKAITSDENKTKPLALPEVKTPLQLPSRELEVVEVEAKPETKALTASAEQAAIVPSKPVSIEQSSEKPEALPELTLSSKKIADAAKKTGEVTGKVVKTASQIKDEVLKEAKNIEGAFANLYQGLKTAIKNKDISGVQAYSRAIEESTVEYQAKIDSFMKEAKESGNEGFGNDVLTKLGGLKGRLTQKKKKAEREVQDFNQEIDITGQSYTVKSLDPNSTESKKTNAAVAALKSAINTACSAIDKLTEDLTGFNTQALKAAGVDTLAKGVERVTGVDTSGKSLGEIAQEVVTSDFAKDLAVNTAGFAASTVAGQHGQIAGLGGDLLGALIARQGINTGIAATSAMKSLSNDPTYKAASALEKASMLLQRTIEILNSDLSEDQNKELFGDLTGFAVGNGAAQLPELMADTALGALQPIPLKGAAVAMAAVPQLSKLRDQLVEQINNAKLTGRDNSVYSLSGGEYGNTPEELLRMLDDLIQSVESTSKAFSEAENRINESFEPLQQETVFQKLEEDQELNVLKGNNDPLPDTKDLEKKIAKENRFDNFVNRIKKGIFPNKETEESVSIFKELDNTLGGLLKAGLGLAGLSFIAPMLGSLANSATDAAQNLETLSVQYKSVFAGAGEAQLEAVSDKARDLKVSLDSAREGYIQLAASFQGTKLEKYTDESFETLTKAFATRGLTNEQQQRAITAVSQMASKGGAIQSEELKGQLAESMPGAIGIFARSQGMGVGEFTAKLNSGQIMAEDAIPKFMQQLDAEASLGMGDAMDSTQASVNNLNNAILQLQESVGAGLLPVKKLGLDAAAGAIDFLTNNIGILLELITALAAASIAKTISQLVDFEAVWKSISNSIGKINFESVFSGITKGIKGFMTQSAFSTAGLTVGLIGIIELAKIFGKAFGDAGSETRKVANEMRDAMKKYEEQLQRVIDKENERKGNQSGNKSEFGDTGESLLEGTIVGSIFGKENVRNFERGTQDWLGSWWNNSLGKVNQNINGFLGKDILPTRIRTYGELAAEQKATANNDVIMASQSASVPFMQLIAQGKNGTGDLATIKNVNRELRDIQTKRRVLDPGDEEGRRGLDAEETRLNALKKDADQNVRMLSGMVNSNIERLKRLRDQAQNEGDTEAFKKFDNELQILIGLQEQYNEVLNDSVDSVKKLETAFQKVQDKLSEMNSLIDRNTANARSGVASDQFADTLKASATEIENFKRNYNDLTDTLNTGESAFKKFQIEQSNFAEKLSANAQAIADAQSVLNNTENQRVLGIAGLSTSSSAADVRFAANQPGMENSQDGDRLNMIATQIDQINNLKNERANIEQSMKDAQVQAAESMRNVSKQIMEFYKSLARSAAEIKLDNAAKDIENSASKTKAKLKASLTGFDNVMSEIASGFAELVDLLAKPQEIMLEYKRAMEAANNEYADNLNNASGLGNQLYSGDASGTDVGVTGVASNNTAGVAGRVASNAASGGKTVPFQGVIVTSAVDASGEPGLDYVVSDGKRGAEFGSLTNGTVIETVTNQNWESHLENGDTRRGYGNRVIVRTVDSVTGEFVDLLYAHLDRVAVRVGQQIGVGTVLGTQGRTGSTTGAHVSVDFFAKDANYAGSAQIAMRDRLARQLANNPAALNQQIQRSQPQPQPQRQQSRPQQQQQRVASGDLSKLFEGGSNSTVAIVVGVSEGNRTASGGFNQSFYGHTDPGNGAHNIGSFSYQGGATSDPREADRIWGNKLKEASQPFMARMNQLGLSDPRLLFNFLDLYTQSPLAASDRGGFIDQLPQIAREGVSEQSILNARMRSYINPATGRLDAPGFGNDPDRLRRDQDRRMAAVHSAMAAVGVTGSSTAQRTSGSNARPSTAQRSSIQTATRPQQQSQPQPISPELLAMSDRSRPILDQAQQQNLSNLQSRRQQLGQNMEAQLSTVDAETQLKYRQLQNRLRQNNVEIQTQTTQTERDAYDYRQSARRDTPATDAEARLEEIRRANEDKIKEVNNKIREVESLIKDTESNLEFARSTPGFQSFVPQLEETLGNARTQLDGLIKARDTYVSTYQDRIKKEEEKINREESDRDFATSQDLFATRQQERQAKIEQLRQPVPNEDPQEYVNRQLQVAQLQADYDKDAVLMERDAKMRQLEYDKLDGKIDAQQYDEAVKALVDSTNAQIEKINAEFERTAREVKREEAQRQLGIRGETLSLETSLVGQRTEQLRRRLPGDDPRVDFDEQAEAANLDAFMQRQNANFSMENQIAQLDANREAAKMSNEEYQRQLDLIKAINESTLSNIQGQLDEQLNSIRQNREEFERFNKEQVFNSEQGILQERASGLSALGFTTQADELNKEIAVNQINFDLSNGIQQLDAMVASGQLAADTAVQLKANLEELSAVKLENVEQQFSIMGKLMPGLQSSFSGFFKDILTGSASIEDALKGLLSSILDQLASLTAQIITNELFGSLFGVNGQGQQGGGLLGGLLGGGSQMNFSGQTSGGGLGSLLGGITGSASSGGGGFSGVMGIAGSLLGMFTGGGIVGFAEGGEIEGGSDIGALKYIPSIAKAMAKEGSKAQLIVASKGELVLTESQARRYKSLGLDKTINNYKTGGWVGNAPATPTINAKNVNGGTSITVPVTVEGGSQPSIDVKRMTESIRQVCTEEILRSRRPGGVGYR